MHACLHALVCAFACLLAGVRKFVPACVRAYLGVPVLARCEACMNACQRVRARACVCVPASVCTVRALRCVCSVRECWPCEAGVSACARMPSQACERAGVCLVRARMPACLCVNDGICVSRARARACLPVPARACPCVRACGAWVCAVHAVWCGACVCACVRCMQCGVVRVQCGVVRAPMRGERVHACARAHTRAVWACEACVQGRMWLRTQTLHLC